MDTYSLKTDFWCLIRVLPADLDISPEFFYQISLFITDFSRILLQGHAKLFINLEKTNMRDN